MKMKVLLLLVMVAALLSMAVQKDLPLVTFKIINNTDNDVTVSASPVLYGVGQFQGGMKVDAGMTQHFTLMRGDYYIRVVHTKTELQTVDGITALVTDYVCMSGYEGTDLALQYPIYKMPEPKKIWKMTVIPCSNTAPQSFGEKAHQKYWQPGYWFDAAGDPPKLLRDWVPAWVY